MTQASLLTMLLLFTYYLSIILGQSWWYSRFTTGRFRGSWWESGNRTLADHMQGKILGGGLNFSTEGNESGKWIEKRHWIGKNQTCL